MRQDGQAAAHVLPKRLAQLEAEAIHVLRETASEFERPVLLCSIGKDSTALLPSFGNAGNCWPVWRRMGPRKPMLPLSGVSLTTPKTCFAERHSSNSCANTQPNFWTSSGLCKDKSQF